MSEEIVSADTHALVLQQLESEKVGRRTAEEKLAKYEGVVVAAKLEYRAYQGLPLIPSGSAHDRWVQAQKDLHEAIEGLKS